MPGRSSAGPALRQAHMIGLDALARSIGVPVPASLDELPADLPQPDGRLGGIPWWWSTTVTEWQQRTTTGERPRPTPPASR